MINSDTLKAQPDLSALKKWYQEHAAEIQKDYFTFLRFKSISTDPAYKKEVEKTAEWLSAYLKEMGFDVEIWQTPGHPVVFGTYMKAGKDRPTVMLYNHYDVQPVDPLELWSNPPFEPIIKEGDVIARGASDNKGQCFYTISALRAFLELAQQIGVNIKVFIEGEEEVGSKGTTAILEKKKKELKADHLLIIDAGLNEKDKPAITLGFRGLITMNIECRHATADLHSGAHGGIILNPIRGLVNLFSKLWDKEGRIAIPHFYDDVKVFTPEELSYLDMSFDEEEYKKKFGIRAFGGEKGYSLIESNWIRPSLEINGISGGYTGEGFKTVLPAKASAKLSCRVAPGQEHKKVEKSIVNFLKEQIEEGYSLDIVVEGSSPGIYCSHRDKIAQISKQAFSEVYGKECALILCGASVPIVSDLKEATGAKVALIGVGLSDDNIHAPNEKFSLDRFEKGFAIIGRIMGLLSEAS
jgi:acetylornithine deacetylase/succinyl-diaminopimelate desuccinylase-like protein